MSYRRAESWWNRRGAHAGVPLRPMPERPVPHPTGAFWVDADAAGPLRAPTWCWGPFNVLSGLLCTLSRLFGRGRRESNHSAIRSRGTAAALEGRQARATGIASEVFTAGAAHLRSWSPAGATDLTSLSSCLVPSVGLRCLNQAVRFGADQHRSCRHQQPRIKSGAARSPRSLVCCPR